MSKIVPNRQLVDYLQKQGACNESIAWLGERDSRQMWKDCDRPDWMMWYAFQYSETTYTTLIDCAKAVKAACKPHGDFTGLTCYGVVVKAWERKLLPPAEICDLIRTVIPECPLPQELQ